ncbi:MAG: secretin N-terminal domain-containing protein [Candidatus Omnitrophota bacterium]
MKKTIRLSIAIIFTIFMSSPSMAAEGGYDMAGKAGAGLRNPISMDFQNANLKTVLKIFSQQSGLNFVASQNIKDRTVTIYFDNVTVEDALNHIMQANRLEYDMAPGSNIFIVKESGKPTIETVTKIYELQFAQLATLSESDQDTEAEIVSVIKDLLTENGKIIADKRSNSLIIKDVPSQFEIVESVLSKIDIRTPQVMIEAEIIETTTSVTDQLGLNWSGSFGIYAGPDLNTRWPLKGALIDKDLITSNGTMKFSGTGFTLSALLSNSDTRILARPKVLTMNNEEALIELTSETAVASVTSTTNTGGDTTSVTSTGAERISTGITLKVTPQINKDGYITMNIEPEVIVPVLSKFFAGSGDDQKFVDPQTRSAKTTVRVKDGETIIIGGLISKEDTYGYEKIPFLGDIPFIGHAFRYKADETSDKELLVFITPRVVKELPEILGRITGREQDKPEAIAREKEITGLLDLLE